MVEDHLETAIRVELDRETATTDEHVQRTDHVVALETIHMAYEVLVGGCGVDTPHNIHAN
jgi:hypothetical protein